MTLCHSDANVQAGIGVSMLGGNGGYFTGSPNYIVRCTFSGFKTDCNRPSAALYLRSGRYKEWFNAANTLTNMTIADDGTTAFYIEPQVLSGPYVEKPGDNGPNSLTYAFRDSDGSVTGGGGGYIIADNKPMAANYKTRVGALCFASPKVTNGLVCPGECYRTVFFRWFKTPLLKTWTPAIQLTRASDGVMMTYPAVNPMWDASIMGVYINLLAGQLYYVTFLAGVPPEFSVQYMEGGPSCPVGVVLRFDAPGPGAIWNTADVLQPWRPEYSSILSPTCAAPMTGETRPTTTTASWACQGGAPVFYIALGPTLGKYDAQIALVKTGTNAYPCNCNGKGVPASPPTTPTPAIKWTMTPPTNVKLTIAAKSSVVFWWGDTLPHSLAGGHSFFVTGPGTYADIRTAPFWTTISFPWSGTWNITCGVYQKRMSASITVVWM